jgi:hypothetical protein
MSTHISHREVFVFTQYLLTSLAGNYVTARIQVMSAEVENFRMQLSQRATDTYARHRVCARTRKSDFLATWYMLTADSSGRLPGRQLAYSRQ